MFEGNASGVEKWQNGQGHVDPRWFGRSKLDTQTYKATLNTAFMLLSPGAKQKY